MNAPFNIWSLPEAGRIDNPAYEGPETPIADEIIDQLDQYEHITRPFNDLKNGKTELFLGLNWKQWQEYIVACPKTQDCIIRAAADEHFTGQAEARRMLRDRVQTVAHELIRKANYEEWHAWGLVPIELMIEEGLI